MPDFSKPETQEVFRREVKKRMDDFGMSREQAEMLVAVLMTGPPKQEAGESETQTGTAKSRSVILEGIGRSDSSVISPAWRAGINDDKKS